MSAGPVRVLPLQAGADLEGPPSEPLHPTGGDENVESGVITGLGLVAYIHRDEGLRGLWAGHEKLAATLVVSVDGEVARPTDRFRWGRGGWAGELATSSGVGLREVGLLSDLARACIVQWKTTPSTAESPPRTLEVRLVGPDTSPVVRLPLAPDGGALALLVPFDDRVATGLLSPPGVRERQRSSRHRSSGRAATAIRVDGRFLPELEGSIRSIEEAPLGDPARGTVAMFLDAFVGGRPSYVEAEHLGALGSAGLSVGRSGLARGCLVRLADDPAGAPTPLLALAADYFLWTGDGGVVSSIEPALREAILATSSAAPREKAERTLAGFVSAFEPLGLDRLQAAAEARLSVIRGEAGPGGVALPTVGETPEVARVRSERDQADATPSAGPADPVLPPGSTSSAARFLLSWTRRTLGVRPEAAYGRIVLSPRFSTGEHSLEVSDLPVGDGSIHLELRSEGRRFEMDAAQHGGRVPFNLACEPWLPTSGLSAVTIDGEPTEIEGTPEDGGTRVRFQLPLDGTRGAAFSFDDPRGQIG